MFRKYEDSMAEDPDAHVMTGQSAIIRHYAGPSAHRPITRSSLKPRLLFSNHTEHVDAEEDEEAPTDIEDHTGHLDEQHESRSDEEERVSRAINASHPDNHEYDTPSIPAPAAPRKAKKVSPFDSWIRQKPGAAKEAPRSTKRGVPDEAEEAVGKRTRSSTHIA